MKTSPALEARHSPRYIASLALAAVAILVLGSLLRPRKPPSESVPPLSPTESQRLLRLAQRQALDTMTDHFTAVAGDVAPRVVELDAPAETGIRWSSDLVVTAAGQGPAPLAAEITLPTGDRLTAQRVVAGPHIPLAAYQLPGRPGDPAGTLAESPPLAPGQWLVSVWRRGSDHAFSPVHYLETRLTSCDELAVDEVLSSLAFSAEMAGGGLFDLDGSLVAVILPCGGRHAALSLENVSRLIALGRGFEAQLLARHGLRVDPVGEAARDHFGVTEGVLVNEVWHGYPAAEAGLQPGDVIVEFDGLPVGSPADLQPLLQPSDRETVGLRARRGRRTVAITLPLGTGSTATMARDGEPVAGVELETPPAGHQISSVRPGSREDEAGIRPGDRIVRVNQVAPRNAAEVRRLLARDGPVFVEVERGRRRIGLLLE